MLWTVVKRELVDHLISLRFSAIFVLTVVLMVIGALVHSANYEREMREYPTRVSQFVDDRGAVNLGSIACIGNATVRQLPNPLSFCSDAGERRLPNEVAMAAHGLMSVQRSSDIGGLFGSPGVIDWTFVIETILSFGAGLLTYKSISGELRDGTLTLVLSHHVSRATVLLGKHFAAMLALATVLVAGMLAGILVIEIRGAVPVGDADGMKILFFAFVSLLYLSVFVGAGLLCSVYSKGPLISAVAFLFLWTAVVFIVPNLGGVVAGFAGNVPSQEEIHRRAMGIDEQLSLTPGMSPEEVASVKLRRELAREQVLLQYLQSLDRQVGLGEMLTRVSPAATFSYAAERLVGGGTYRMMGFVGNAVHYREGFLQAIVAADREDPASEHRYVPWWCGDNHFSQRLVDLGPLKEFRDQAPSSLENLGAAVWDILILVSFNVIVLVFTFWRFARQNVAPTPGVT